MSLSSSLGVWFISFFFFLFIVYIGYKIGHKLGLKKALFRTTYILISVIFAFVLTPILNRELFNLDLRKLNITLTYKDEQFYTLIDYIEEVIAHSKFLNDIYAYVPSLKDLFMDFPEVILSPVTYVLLFIIFLIIWLPLYLYLSYKRKTKILYEKKENEKNNVWAGIITAVQLIFIFSVVLTPINGINRIYQDAVNDTLDEEYTSICDDNVIFSDYSKICDLIELYDSSIFADLGNKGGFNNFVFDSLTRISYDGGYTSIAKESSMMVKGTIVLDQSGLLDIMEEDLDIIPTSLIMNNKLSEKDIDIIVNTLRESKYSREVLIELGDLVTNTLKELLSQILTYEDFKLDYSMGNDKIVSEIKVVLNAIKMLSGTDLLPQILVFVEKIENFIRTVPNYSINEIVVFDFILDLVNSVDLDKLESFGEYLLESSTFNKVIPYIIDNVFFDAGFSFVSTNGDLLDQFYNFLDFGRLVKKYQTNDPLKLVADMSDEDVVFAAELFQYVASCPETKPFVDFLFSLMLESFDYYSLEDIYAIPNWSSEALYIREFCSILYESIRVTGKMDLIRLANLFKYKDDSLFVDLLIRLFKINLPSVLEFINREGGYIR